MVQGIWTLFKKDLLLEIRQQYSFYGILLYAVSTLFILYLSMDAPEPKVWNGLFWVIQLFICTNAVAKGFLQESRGRWMYYYTLAHPITIILAKLLFNILLMGLMSLISLLLFRLFLGAPYLHTGRYIGIVLLGGISLSVVFSFLAAIAAKAQQNAAVLAILGFPLILPQLILLQQISTTQFSVSAGTDLVPIALLIGLDVLVVILASILFPFIWKE
ncbi:MAG: heme exporter protein CcmB [Bacteroidota bacterium]